MSALIAPLLAAAALSAEAPLDCVGEHRQGAMLICRTEPGATVTLGDAETIADETGLVVIGHDRDAPAEVSLGVETPSGTVRSRTVEVAQREYEIQRIEGVPQQFVTPSQETLERRRREAVQKAEAYTSRWSGQGFAGGFAMPLDAGRVTGVYGSQRYYNGEPRRPHYGIDIAAPGGTPITAPAGGVVTLAEPDMYWEGGLVFIDHGQGLTSAFLHLGEVSVSEGDVVEKGEVIGAVGSGGRSTGAHLDWRIKWRGRQIDPSLAVAVDPDVLAFSEVGAGASGGDPSE